MGKPILNFCCCCFTLQRGIMAGALIYSIGFGGGLLGLLTANSQYKVVAQQ